MDGLDKLIRDNREVKVGGTSPIAKHDARAQELLTAQEVASQLPQIELLGHNLEFSPPLNRLQPSNTSSFISLPGN